MCRPWCPFAQVMANKNLSTEVKNGMCGRVIGFQTRSVEEGLAELSERDAPSLPFGVDVTQALTDFPRVSPTMDWPVVAFSNRDGVQVAIRTVEPEKFSINDASTGEPICERLQVPLLPAYAITIHKVRSLSVSFQCGHCVGLLFSCCVGCCAAALAGAVSVVSLSVLSVLAGPIHRDKEPQWTRSSLI